MLCKTQCRDVSWIRLQRSTEMCPGRRRDPIVLQNTTQPRLELTKLLEGGWPDVLATNTRRAAFLVAERCSSAKGLNGAHSDLLPSPSAFRLRRQVQLCWPACSHKHQQHQQPATESRARARNRPAMYPRNNIHVCALTWWIHREIRT